MAFIAVVVLGGYGLSRLTQRAPLPPPGGGANPLPQAAYVRERIWNEAVRDAVRGAMDGEVAAGDAVVNAPSSPNPEGAAATRLGPPPLESLTVLCAEVSGGAAVTKPAGLDWPFLASLPRPVGLLVRVRAVSAGGREEAEIRPEREPFPTLRRVLDETFASAAAAGLHPKEVLLDFDCPVTQLRGYAACLAVLRDAYPGEAFQPTARASWLRSPDFAPLARAAGGYVLEVHGLVRSGSNDGKVSETLCDPGAAEDAVESAGALGVPFRVALPASGYRLILDASGRLVSATAETRGLPPARLPAGGSERILRPNAEDLAGLVTQWNWRHPAALRGILWDRLPVEGERLDWPLQTFRAVRAGRVPKSHLEWKFPEPTEGSDGRVLALHNTGDADAPLPPLLTIRCPEPPLAVEAAGPYEVVPRTPKEHLSPREVRFRLMKPAADPPGDATAATPPPPRTLPPGATLRFGSVRLPSANSAPTPGPEEMEMDLELKSPASPSPGADARH